MGTDSHGEGVASVLAAVVWFLSLSDMEEGSYKVILAPDFGYPMNRIEMRSVQIVP